MSSTLAAGIGRIAICLTLALLGRLPGTLLAADWPQHLGPQRTGISTETGLIDAFPASGPEILWKVPGGVGMSGIAVADGLAITLVQKQERQWLLALDAVTGKEKWASDLAPAYENAMGDGPRATPTLLDGTAYAYSGEGVLAAVELKSGKIRWSHNVPVEQKAKPSEYGMSCSPLVTETHVIVAAGAADATLIAFDRKSGKQAWSWQRFRCGILLSGVTHSLRGATSRRLRRESSARSQPPDRSATVDLPVRHRLQLQHGDTARCGWQPVSLIG